MVAVAMMTVGCSSIEEAQLMGPVPIKLTASVGVETVTRGADGKIIETDATITRGIQENALATDETVYVWANEQGSSTWDYLKAWTLTNASTGLTGSTQYYPADGTSITMNAVHGNFAETLTEGTTAISSLTHSVLADQNAEKGYEKSDLLFGSVTGSKASTTAPNIAFAHKLSKIEVNLSAGYGYVDTDLSDAQVHLNNVKPSVTINAADGTIGAASGTAITIKTRKTGAGTFEAVIPPQTFDNPDALIAVTTTKDNLTLTSTVPNDVATYASDTRYVYNVAVHDYSYLPDPKIGDYFYADGTWSTTYDNTHGDVVGLVFSTTTSAIDRAAGFTHGYVIALNDCGNSGEFQWRNSKTATGISNSSDIDGHGNSFTAVIHGTVFSTVLAAVKADLDGRTRCYLVSQLSGYSSTTFPAFAAAYAYTPVPSKDIIYNSGWYLPSIGQQYAILNNFCNLPPNTSGSWPGTSETWRGSPCYDFYYAGKASATRIAINKYFEKRLKTDVEATGNTAVAYTAMLVNSTNKTYWSSTEATAEDSWEINLHYDDDRLYIDGTGDKTYGAGVNRHARAVLAF